MALALVRNIYCCSYGDELMSKAHERGGDRDRDRERDTDRHR